MRNGGIPRIAPRGAGIGGPEKGKRIGGSAKNPRKNTMQPLQIGFGENEKLDELASIVDDDKRFEDKKAEMLITYGGIGHYTPDLCHVAAKFGESGRSKNELARFLKISAKTLRRWAAEHEEFSLAIDYLETARAASLEACLRKMIETGQISNERVRALEFLLRSCAAEYRLPN